MSSDFISGTVLTAEALNTAFAHHVDCSGGDQMYGPLFMWDGDGGALSSDGTDYMQGACRGWVRDYVVNAIYDTWTHPPGNTIYLPVTGGTLIGNLTITPPNATSTLVLNSTVGTFAGIIQSQKSGIPVWRWSLATQVISLTSSGSTIAVQ